MHSTHHTSYLYRLTRSCKYLAVIVICAVFLVYTKIREIYTNHIYKHKNPSYDVDLVYLRVDQSDVQRAKKKSVHSVSQDSEHACIDATDAVRFNNYDELKYSLRSMSRYAPRIRHIYIITDEQVPDWLDTTHPAIHIIDHTQLLPAQHLPTYNSNVLESVVHTIPGLAEHFVYCNDDVMCGSTVYKQDFFGRDGASMRTFLDIQNRPVATSPVSPQDTSYTISQKNTFWLLESVYGYRSRRWRAHHQAKSGLKSYIQSVYSIPQITASIQDMQTHRLRSSVDIHPPSLRLHAGRMDGITQITPISQLYHEYSVRPPRVYKTLLMLQRLLRPKLLCTNNIDAASQAYVSSYLQDYYPTASVFEH